MVIPPIVIIPAGKMRFHKFLPLAELALASVTILEKQPLVVTLSLTG